MDTRQNIIEVASYATVQSTAKSEMAIFRDQRHKKQNCFCEICCLAENKLFRHLKMHHKACSKNVSTSWYIINTLMSRGRGGRDQIDEEGYHSEIN